MKYRNSAGYLLFASAYLLCMVEGMLIKLSTFGDMQYAGMISWAMWIGAAVLILIKLFTDRFYSRKMLVYIACTGLLLLVVFLKSGYNHVFSLMILALGVRGIDIERILKFDLVLRLCLIVCIIFCGLTGIIENYVTNRYGIEEIRYSLGFNHPNTMASIVFGMILEEAYINKRRFSVAYTLIIWAICAIVFKITINRTAVLLMALFPLLLLVVNRKNDVRISRRCEILIASMFIVAAAISYMAMKLCQESALFGTLDQMLSMRFTNAGKVYDQYGIALFGQRVTLISPKIARRMHSNIAMLDVAYLRMLIQAGPVVLMYMWWLHAGAVREACLISDKMMLIILCVFLAFGICESGYNNICMNFSLLIMAAAPFEKFERDIHNKNVSGSELLEVKS